MLRIASTFMLLLVIASSPAAQQTFDDFFADGVLRVDYYHGLNKERHLIIPDGLCREPYYGGPKDRLIQELNMGSCRFVVVDSGSGQPLFSDAYSSMFDEWQHTQEAKAGQLKLYHESVRFPFPRKSVLLRIEVRLVDGNFVPVYERYINPLDIAINRESPTPSVESGDLCIRGLSSDKVDVVFLAEGYTKTELPKFKKDATKLADFLLAAEPFKKYADRFNFRYVASVSEESGTDEPDKGVYRNTVLNSSFNTFNVARYITSSDNKTMRDLAGKTAYDHIVVLANSSRYGGGGFYNLYSLFCSDMPYLSDVFVHEFGHQFGGLADEYDGEFTDTYYNLAIEPWEANITTTTDMTQLKWKKYISGTTPLPTPNDTIYRNMVGLFEGGGYSTKGIYRSQLYCIMRSFDVRTFCAACQGWLTFLIQHHTR